MSYTKTDVISFYSYKGGSGRSTACVNFLHFFAKLKEASPEHPIILVDCDIDSAGLTYLLQRNSRNSELIKNISNGNTISLQTILFRGDEPATQFVKNGTTVLKTYAPTIENNVFFRNLIPVGDFFGLEDKTVLFIACNLNIKSNNFNLNDLCNRNFSDIAIMAIKYQCSAVVFDCPSGTQELAMWSVNESSNIVCCLRPTYQFRRGTADSMIKVMDKQVTFFDKQIIVCPNAVSRRNVEFYGKKYPEYIRVAIKEDVLNILESHKKDHYKIIDKMLYNSSEDLVQKRRVSSANCDLIGIPEVERFKWYEDCLGKEGTEHEDEELAVERYKYLASLIK